MISVQRFPQELAVEVGIDFRGCDAFVAQHFLYGAEVSTAFHEMGGDALA
jgi:hypothetical protein